MEQETLISSTVDIILSSLFGNMEKSVTIRRMNDGSFNIYITSPDERFLAMIVGKKGGMVNALREVFTTWAYYNRMRLEFWVERTPIKKYD